MRRRLGFESLELRSMLSATVGASGSLGPQNNGEVAPAGAIVFHARETAAQIEATVRSSPAGSEFFFTGGTYLNVAIVPVQGDTFIGGFNADLVATLPTTLFAFDSYGNGGGANVTISNLTIANYKATEPSGYGTITFNSPPYAAVSAGDGWHMDHLLVEGCTSCGVQVCDGGSITNSILEYNGQEGGKAAQYPQYETTNAPITVSNNLIAYNNRQYAFSPTFEAGGFKTYDTNNVTFSNNTVMNNNGNGVWFDTNCSNTVIANNLIENNSWSGIDLEISLTTQITGNVITGNAFASNPQWPPAGIQMQDDSNVTVSGNTLSNNGNTVILFSSFRNDLNTNWTLTNVAFSGNTFTATTGIVAGIASANNTGSNPYAPGNVTFKNNTYNVSGNAGFIYQDWLTIDETFAQWEALGNG